VGIASQGQNVDPAEIERIRRALDPWRGHSEQDIGELAWTVVGPNCDDPGGGQKVEESHAEYWAYLAGLLQDQGIHVQPAVLQALPYDVELRDRIRARIVRAAPSPETCTNRSSGAVTGDVTIECGA
jgi:hypothetical protein